MVGMRRLYFVFCINNTTPLLPFFHYARMVLMFELHKIRKKLEHYRLPCLDKTLTEANAIRDLSVHGKNVQLSLEFYFPLPLDEQDALIVSIKQLLSDFQVTIDIKILITTHICQPHVQLLSGVKNIIAISSGKGGVGKSTTAVNLALAIKQLGARVGLLDADIYGPNQPHMLGIEQRPEIVDDKWMVPIERFGMQTISFGNLIGADTPAVWRGPMVTKALQQLVFQTKWHDLDYLIIDMPPGTGDIQLTLSKYVPVSGAVVVTTPQDIALIDARKGLEMFQKVNVNLLGIVENMSSFQCPHCGEKTALFGDDGGDALSRDTGVPLLGKVPLMLDIRRDLDRGVPTVEANPDSDLAKLYRCIALTLVARLSLMPVVEVI